MLKLLLQFLGAGLERILQPGMNRFLKLMRFIQLYLTEATDPYRLSNVQFHALNLNLWDDIALFRRLLSKRKDD